MEPFVVFILILVLLYTCPEAAVVVILITLAMGAAGGCPGPTNVRDVQPSQNLLDYKCNGHQLFLLRQEVDLCTDAGGDGVKCFTQAKLTLCTEINKDTGKEIPIDKPLEEIEEEPFHDEEIEALLREEKVPAG